MKRLVIFVVLIFVSAIGFSSLNFEVGFATPTPSVTIVNQGGLPNKYVPDNLVWSSKSLQAGIQAKNYFSSILQGELQKLRTRGAVTITSQSYSTQNNEYQDWATYTPVWNQYRLTGWNAEGKKVGVSGLLPTDTPNLASRLVLVKVTPCSLSQNGLQSSKPKCQLTNPEPEAMLRAALRTSIAFSEGDITDFYFQQLKNCLDSNYAFTIKSGTFDCPQNAAIFGGNRSFPVSGVASDHNYSFTVDKSTRKAIWTNSPKDYSFQAKNAQYGGKGIIGFRSPTN